MQLSFYSVISYRGTPVAVVLIGHTGCYHFEQLEGLPVQAAAFIGRLLSRLEQRPRWRELLRLSEQVGAGPTQMSEPQPVTFTDPEPVLENLAKRYLAQPAAAAG